jgi:integrase/recombinase XerD
MERWTRVFDDVERDVGSIRLPRWGRVVSVAGTVPWLVVDPDGVPVEPVRRFLVDFVARDNRPGSVRPVRLVSSRIQLSPVLV